MSQDPIGRRSLLGMAASFALAGSASALPRQSPASCKGQPEIKPLEPLQVVTSRGPQRFLVEVARTPRQREYGLMCRRTLAADRGMLFLFERPDIQAFWMRNTLIPLDIIYLDAGGRVVSIKRMKPMERDARGEWVTTPSDAPAKYAIELNEGAAAAAGVKVGDRLEIPAEARDAKG